jgi:hypothetical protein
LAIKYYNKETGQWVNLETNLAKNIKVTDADNLFSSNNVEGCLKELGEKLTADFSDISAQAIEQAIIDVLTIIIDKI